MVIVLRLVFFEEENYFKLIFNGGNVIMLMK